MRFLIDADLPYSLAEVLSRHGHEAIRVRDALGSATDEEVFDYASRNECIIVTRDLGFAEEFMKKKGFGLLLVRLPYYFTASKIKRVFEEFVKETNVNELVNSITVLELGRYRIKKL
jgi:predicted nuclease of predicted toxin-antitoxin system